MLALPTKEAMMRRFCTVLAVLFGISLASSATAQEIQLTGPLAGAAAVRQLRLHRQGRFEIAPTVSFTLLDEYQRTILAGARLNYNITDWLAIGGWFAGGAAHVTTGLSDHIQEVTATRRATEPNNYPPSPMAGISINNLLTRASIGDPFKNQLGTINSVISPQITLVPFRGKLAIFQKIFVDTDAYIFGGPAFVGLKERSDCDGNCDAVFTTQSRTAIAPTFGLGLSFYIAKFLSLGLEWRGLPFAWNTGGFDTHGGPPGGKFPDNKINKDDREFKFNQLLSVSLGFYLPTKLKSSE
jgi:outer membrane beta-barrel protein